MTYSIIGTGSVGRTLAGFFAKAGVEVALANTRGDGGRTTGRATGHFG